MEPSCVLGASLPLFALTNKENERKKKSALSSDSFFVFWVCPD